MDKIHLESIEDFTTAVIKTQRAITELLTYDISEDDYNEYIHGNWDTVILTLTTTKMKRDYTFSNALKELIGGEDALFD